MSVVLVTGGTGTLGRAVVPALRARGHDVRVLSRRAGSEAGRIVGDLSSGAGLDRALDDVDLVVHAATANGREDVRQARNLLAAMRPHQHLLAVSIVGIDRIPLPYYRAKLEVEELIRSSANPWTLQRSTQFHDLVARIFALQRRLPVLLAPDFAVQPIDVRDVAAQLAALASDPPGGRAPDLGGPAVRQFRELADVWRSARGSGRRIVPLRLPGKIFAGYRSGAHTVPDRAVGRITFEEFLGTGSGNGGG
ncbi:SDR family oxidoreductase [Lysobacter korlensis]|uniref:SDR family oxidoreductase n=1 Tax=Lysobacter korlensis TaxID=553636 RepID=A0ABV6RQK5_9GAMM